MYTPLKRDIWCDEKGHMVRPRNTFGVKKRDI